MKHEKMSFTRENNIDDSSFQSRCVRVLLCPFRHAGRCSRPVRERNTYQRQVKARVRSPEPGRSSGARDAFEEAMKYYDADPAAHLGLGIANYHLKDERTAERELQRALELNPGRRLRTWFSGYGPAKG